MKHVNKIDNKISQKSKAFLPQKQTTAKMKHFISISDEKTKKANGKQKFFSAAKRMKVTIMKFDRKKIFFTFFFVVSI